MSELPASYRKYLEGRDPIFVDTVRPVLLQSAADQSAGVRIVLDPHLLQAHIDERIPYGQIIEDVD